jgi:hypothetical protein
MPKTKAQRLSAANRFQVWEITRDTYAQAKLSDKDFAAKLSEQLGYPVADSTIMDARKAFDIPAYRSTIVAGRQNNVLERLAVLEGAVQALIVRVQALEAEK